MNAHSRGLWMWSQACAALDEAERRHRRFFELLGAPARAPVWEPPVDVFVHEREFHVVVALPGVRPDSVSIELSSTGLWVRAESRLPIQGGRARVLRLEIPYGRIERRIELPPGGYQLLGEEYADGCLHLRLSGTAL